MGRRREINWGAVGAIAGIAGVVVALAATNNSHSNVAGDPVEVTSKEPTPSPAQSSELGAPTRCIRSNSPRVSGAGIASIARADTGTPYNHTGLRE